MDPLITGWDFVMAGGPVMLPLLAVSVWLWTLIILKAGWLINVRRNGFTLLDAVKCLEGRAEPPAGSGPRERALNWFLHVRTRGRNADQRLLEAAVRRQETQMWKHITPIVVLAAVAPLLGLLGTVTGMIDTFQVIQLFGTGNAQAMASGISEALITTQTGLLVAIPGLFAGYILKRQVGHEQNRLFSFQQALSRWLEGREVDICCA